MRSFQPKRTWLVGKNEFYWILEVVENVEGKNLVVISDILAILACRKWNLQELHLRSLSGSTTRISELSGENPACKCRLHRFHLKLLLFFNYLSPLPTSYQVARSGGSVASTLAGKRPKTQTKSPFLKDISALSTKSAAESAKRNCSKFTVGRPSLTP